MSEGFENYPERGKKPYPAIRATLIGIGVLVLGAYAVILNAREGEWLKVAIVGWFALTLGLSGVGIGFMKREPRARFCFLNSSVMTRTERAPVDSWVHVAPTKALPMPLLVCLVLFPLGLVAVLIAAVLQLVGVIPRLNEDTSLGAFLFAILLCLALIVASGSLAYLNVARKWRNGRFGARPSGVALGEHTVSIRMPGRDGEIAWEHIRDVGSFIVSIRWRPLAMIKLELDAAAGLPGDTQMLSAEGYTVPTDALYTALRWYAAHPEYRWELGRTEGERRIEGWRQDALASSAQ